MTKEQQLIKELLRLLQEVEVSSDGLNITSAYDQIMLCLHCSRSSDTPELYSILNEASGELIDLDDCEDYEGFYERYAQISTDLKELR